MDFLKKSAKIFFIMVLAHLAQPAQAQTFSSGYQKYQKGDFAGADVTFSQALKGATGGERTKILKFKGISQFMMGNKNGASTSFKEALTIAPSLTIDATDVLDDSVILFFESIKSNFDASANRGEAGKSVKPGGPGVSNQKETNQTLLRIISTPANTEISIDGIFAGRGGELINADPGNVVVTISAPDYESKEMKLNIKKNRENTVTVVLEKTRSKQKPTASKPKEQTPPQGAPLAANPRKKEPPTATKKPPPPPQGQAAGPNLAQQFEMDAASASQPPPYAPPGAPGYGPPGYYGGYGYRPPTARRRSREDTDYFYLSLPFGAGQFHQERYIAGSFFLAAEAYGIYLAITTHTTLQKATKEETRLRQECTESSPCPDEQYGKDRDKFLADFPSYRRKANNTVTGASIAVFTLMLWGAADAIIKDPSYQTVPAPKRPRRTSEAEGYNTSEHRPSRWDWHMALLPPSSYDEDPTGAIDTSLVSSPKEATMGAPGVVWNMEWNF